MLLDWVEGSTVPLADKICDSGFGFPRNTFFASISYQGKYFILGLSSEHAIACNENIIVYILYLLADQVITSD